MLRVDITAPAALCEELIAYLSQNASQGWQENETEDAVTFGVFVEDATYARSLTQEIASRWPEAEATVTEIEEQDWGQAWRDFFSPIVTGETFEVLPPWLADEDTGGRTRIIIEPGMAFGTGHHATTALCLEALGGLVQQGRLAPGSHFLDLGTGSGILAIALCKTGLTGRGLDIDPQAIVCVEENLAANNCLGSVRAEVGSINDIPSGETFEIIVANILSEPLIAMADSIAKRLSPDGCLVLSGILAVQADDVIRAYGAAGMGDPEILARDEWVALIWS